jgi:hypothetical protein
LKKDDVQSSYVKAGSIREPIEQIFIILKRDEAEHGVKMGWREKES